MDETTYEYLKPTDGQMTAMEELRAAVRELGKWFCREHWKGLGGWTNEPS